VLTYRFAVGHEMEDGHVGVARPWPLPRACYPAGGIASHVKELLRYARFHMGDGAAEGGRRMLRPESLALMRRPQAPIDQRTRSVGLSWFIDDLDGVTVLSHGGGTKGQISQLVIVPERGLALAIVTNSESGNLITLEARRWTLRHYLGLVEGDPDPITLPAGDLEAYTGRYTRPYAEVEITAREGQLWLDMTFRAGFPSRDVPPPPPPPSIPAAFFARDLVWVPDGPFRGGRGEFVRRADGEIGWARFGGRLYRREP
jgi:CubicO group peptidase (beta-lactamase class C family)